MSKQKRCKRMEIRRKKATRKEPQKVSIVLPGIFEEKETATISDSILSGTLGWGTYNVTFSPRGKFIMAIGENKHNRGVIKIWDAVSKRW